MSKEPFPGLGSLAKETLGGRTFVFLACLAACFLITFARNPDPYFQRILFAEDGNAYYGRIQADGFWPTVLKARSDYYVFGNIAIAWIGIRACDLFAGGDLFVLPAYLAATSYLFFAIVAALPALLLRGRIALGWLVALSILTALLPLDGQDNEILGRIANTGYSWLYVAFLAVIRRAELVRFSVRSPGRVAEIVGLDLLILASAATNPIALALLPAVALAYWKPTSNGQPTARRGLLRFDLISAAALAASCLPIALRIILKDRQMDEPIHAVQPTIGQVVELLVARGLLFPIVHPFYTSLNTAIVLGLLVVVVGAFLVLGRRRNRSIYLVGAFLLGTSVAALGALRPELFGFSHGYRDTFPLRYVLGQNAIALCLLAVLAGDVTANRRLPRWVRVVPILLAVGSCVDIGRQSSFGAPGYQFVQFGELADQVALATANRQFRDRAGAPDPHGEWLEIRSYPAYDAERGLAVLVERAAAEQALLKRADSRPDFQEALVVVRQEQTRRKAILARDFATSPARRYAGEGGRCAVVAVPGSGCVADL